MEIKPTSAPHSFYRLYYEPFAKPEDIRKRNGLLEAAPIKNFPFQSKSVSISANKKEQFLKQYISSITNGEDKLVQMNTYTPVGYGLVNLGLKDDKLIAEDSLSSRRISLNTDEIDIIVFKESGVVLIGPSELKNIPEAVSEIEKFFEAPLI